MSIKVSLNLLQAEARVWPQKRQPQEKRETMKRKEPVQKERHDMQLLFRFLIVRTVFLETKHVLYWKKGATRSETHRNGQVALRASISCWKSL